LTEYFGVDWGEFDLLAAFVNPNQVLTRDQLLHFSRDREAGRFDRRIDVQVGRLRSKLEDDLILIF
jgi:two-component system OmpR family response regulator